MPLTAADRIRTENLLFWGSLFVRQNADTCRSVPAHGVQSQGHKPPPGGALFTCIILSLAEQRRIVNFVNVDFTGAKDSVTCNAQGVQLTVSVAGAVKLLLRRF